MTTIGHTMTAKISMQFKLKIYPRAVLVIIKTNFTNTMSMNTQKEPKQLIKCDRCHRVAPLGEVLPHKENEEKGLCEECMVEVAKRNFDNKQTF